jgi:hypothetical protein
MGENYVSVILSRIDLPAEKIPSGNIFKCNENGCMIELVVEWLREAGDRRRGCSSELKRHAGFRCFQGSCNRESGNSSA